MKKTTRREFGACVLSGLTAAVLPRTVEGQVLSNNKYFSDNTFTFGDIKVADYLNVKADVFIDGLKVPAFSPAWFAINVATGVLGSIGGALFSGFLSAVFGGNSMEALLSEYLKRTASIIEEIVDAKLKQEALEQAKAKLAAVRDKMAEYARAPEGIDRLHFATDDSVNLVHQLQRLKYLGYSTWLSAASMRLAVLQERAKLYPRDKANFNAARNSLIAYHTAIEKQIKDDLSPSGQVERIIKEREHRGEKDIDVWGFGKPSDIMRRDPNKVPAPARIYGIHHDEMPLNPNCPLVIQRAETLANLVGMKPFDESKRLNVAKVWWERETKAMELIDWNALREKVRKDTTAVGEKVVKIWEAFRFN